MARPGPPGRALAAAMSPGLGRSAPWLVVLDLYEWHGSYMGSITVTEARERLADVIDEARRNHEPVFIYRLGRRLAAVIDAEDLDRLEPRTRLTSPRPVQLWRKKVIRSPGRR